MASFPSNTFYRTEHDSMGEVKVPKDALYQAQTQRAVDNFSMSSLTMPPRFIQSIAMIKQAAAKANEELDLLGSAMSKAIQASCQAIIDGEYL